MPRKKRKNGLSQFVEDLTDWYKENQLIRVVAFAGILVVIVYYLMVVLSEDLTIIQGIADWGIDQGYTTILHAIILLGFSVFILLYPFQKRYKTRGLDAFWRILITFPLGFVVYLLFFWQFVAHLPFFNFYHRETFMFGDKITHFLVALIITLVAVRWNPKLSTVVIVFLVITAYELFEIAWIVNVSGLYEIQWQYLPIIDLLVEDLQAVLQALIPISEIEDLLVYELVDVFPDMIFNTLGVGVGYFFTRNLIEKEEKKARRKRK